MIQKENAILKKFVGTPKVHQITGRVSKSNLVSQHIFPFRENEIEARRAFCRRS